MKYLAPDDFSSRSSLAMSPNGKRIAYVVQVPDVKENVNREALYAASLADKMESSQAPVLVLPEIVAVHWFDDNRHIAALVRDDNRMILVRIDSDTGQYDIIWRDTTDITDYSMSADGRIIAIAVSVPSESQNIHRASQDIQSGYRIDFQSSSAIAERRRRVFIVSRGADSRWIVTRQIEFRSPLSGREITNITDDHSMHINISPNGRYLLLDNGEDYPLTSLPALWNKDPFVHFEKGRGNEVLVSYLYDLETGHITMPLQSPVVRSAVWAPDSRSYAVRALAPVGSRWEAADLAKGVPSDHATHLFTVDVETGATNQVQERSEEGALGWTMTGALLVRNELGAIMMFRREANTWVMARQFHIPLPDLSAYGPVVTDGSTFIGEYEKIDVAPRLFEYSLSSNSTNIIAELDPEAEHFVLPKAEKISWTTSTGYRARGVLLLPPDYDPKKKYPLVIENGSLLYGGEFVCDSGPEHVSSFARGILADSGIMYLMRSWPGIASWDNEFFPKGFPGGVAEAVFRMNLVESAVRYLNNRGMIDVHKVGLIGFSRGGWYTEFALAHSPISFAAATATDNVQYSLGEYWDSYNESLMHNEEAMYGGPPYGATLRNWIDYSISFNLDKIHTPLLIEVMGDGLDDDDPRRTPFNLAVHSEIYVGLRALHKPAELYYYPNEQHQPAHPQARVKSLQRNVDWFRFWLQDYRRPRAEDMTQYMRWEDLRMQTERMQSPPQASPLQVLMTSQ